MKKLFKVLIFSLFIFFVSCEKDVTAPNFEDLSIQISDHFLHGYFVTSISFDSKGTAWIGTFKQGLIEYDNTATLYNSKNSILPDSIVMWDITVDYDDNIWIGSSIGLIKYDRQKFTIYNTYNSPVPENVVWAVAVDQNNNIWFASCRFRQGGLVKFDGTNWTLYTPKNSQLPSNSVRDIVVDCKDNIWIAMSETVGNGCIIKISGNNWETFGKSEIGFSLYYFGNLTIDHEGNLYGSIDYVLSSFWDMTRPNIIKFNGKTWTIQNPVDENGESLGYVGRIAADFSGNIWATLHGKEGCAFAGFNGKKWFYNDSDFPVEYIYKIAIDPTNRIWLGTGDGIYVN